MSYFGMYLLTKLDCWHNMFQASGWILLTLITGLLVIILCIADCNSGSYAQFKNVKEAFPYYYKFIPFRKAFIVSLIFIILGALLPTTKQAAFIYIAPQIIENGAVKDTVKNIPELTKLGTDYLKELLKEKVENVK